METTQCCVSIGSTSSLEHLEFWRIVPEPMEFEQILVQMQKKQD